MSLLKRILLYAFVCSVLDHDIHWTRTSKFDEIRCRRCGASARMPREHDPDWSPA